MKRRHSSPRGAAAIETAITMVVLVPLTFYALFIQDFLSYKLEGQEPTVVAPWDFVTPDYMRNNAFGITGMNRLKYCDHTAAYDSYNRDFDCDNIGGALGGVAPDSSVTGSSPANMGHHHATGAHQCWLGGGQQITCTINRQAGLPELFAAGPAFNFGTSDWNNGGMAVCSARLNVFNSIIPKSLSSEGGWLWDRAQLTDKTRFGRKGGGDTQGLTGWDDQYGFNDIHLDGTSGDGSGTGTGSWLLNTEEVALLVDPWALTHIQDITPHSFAVKGKFPLSAIVPGGARGVDQYHPLLDRTGHYYNYYADKNSAVSNSNNWHDAMTKRDLLDPVSNEDVTGDYLGSVPVMWKKELTRRADAPSSGYASGWEDTRMQNVTRPTAYPPAWGPKGK